MKIIYDNIIFSQQKAGGISIVWYEIIKRLLKEKHITTFFIEYKNGNKNIFRNLLCIQMDRIFKHSGFILKIRRYFNPILSLTEKTIFHSSYYRTCNHKFAFNVTTVHDFTYEKYYHGIAKSLHCFQKYRAINNSDIIICISENTKNDLMKYLPKTDKNKIRVIYNGVSDDYFKIENPIINQIPFAAQSYMIFVGSRKAYKRFDFAVDVVRKINFNLIIVGGGDLTDQESKLLDSEIGVEKYKHMGSILNNQLNELYNNAFCLIYPSEYEGFGIPVIEAQKAGCPVVAFNGSSIKEIAGNTPLLFKEYNIDKISSNVSMLFDISKRNLIIQEGIINAKRFSWDITYSQIISVYREILN